MSISTVASSSVVLIATAKVSDRTLAFIQYDNGGVPITLHQYVKDWQQNDFLEKYSVAEICKRIAKAKSLEGVTTYLRSLRKSGDLGPRTYNHYLQAIDTFFNWCVTTKRLLTNPLMGVERLNVEVDVWHKR